MTATHRNRISTLLIVVLCVVGCVAVVMWGKQYQSFGGMGHDQGYQVMSCLQYRHSPLAPLSFALGYLWLKIFGCTLMAVHGLQVFCSFITTAIGVMFFYYRTRSPRVSAILFATVFIGSQVWSADIFNWDTASYPFVMLCLVCTISYWKRPDIYKAALMGITAVLMIAARIPNVAVLPLLLIVLIARRHGCIKSLISELLIGLVGISATTLVLILSIYGNFAALEEAWTQANIINGHIGAPSYYVIERTTETFACVGLFSLFGIAAICAGVLLTYIKRYRVPAFVFIGAFLCITTVLNVKLGNWSILWGLAYPSFFILAMWPWIIKCLKPDNNIPSKAMNLIISAFAIMPIVGSDAFIERILAGPVIPIALALCYNQLKQYVVPVCAFTLVILSSWWIYYFGMALVRPYNDLSSISPYLKNIKADDEWLSFLSELKTTTDRLNEQETDYLFMGWGNYNYALIFNVDAVTEIHHFHYFNVKADIDYLNSLFGDTDRYQAMIHTGPVYPYTEQDVVDFEDYLGERGFVKDNDKKAFTLWQRK